MLPNVTRKNLFGFVNNLTIYFISKIFIYAYCSYWDGIRRIGYRCLFR